ncbi:hypothetical protein N657DRAFT_500547 [Parathielavia appendiculata]|uniref:Uncharacterized protein n=1 Tax=Parathielavia appendiculata TaxID=2587402 RepID=A0AAN6TX19_9PEZI|nr:hypothetical protein N657DRAFT_500547 [Parathielavia appendiculata]
MWAVNDSRLEIRAMGRKSLAAPATSFLVLPETQLALFCFPSFPSLFCGSLFLPSPTSLDTVPHTRHVLCCSLFISTLHTQNPNHIRPQTRLRDSA